MAKWTVSGNTITKGTPSKSSSISEQTKAISKSLDPYAPTNPLDMPGARGVSAGVNGATRTTATTTETPQVGMDNVAGALAEDVTQYQVKQGDTLGGIAKAQGVNMGDISGYKSGNPNLIYPGENLSISQQYNKGLALTKQPGFPESPQDIGAGGAGTSQIMSEVQGTPPEPPSSWSNVYDLSPGVDKDFLDYDTWMSPTNQKETLKQEYESLQKSLTIGGKTAEQLDMEMIDADAVINGTEDSIRAEVLAAGGFATDSQVQALAISRNKSLIKNYDRLVSMRKSLDTQLSTTMELSMKDRQLASEEFDRKMNYKFKVAEFQERATTNARNTYMTLGESMGWDTLFNGMTPYEQSIAQKTMGISPMQAQQLALKSQQDRAMEAQENELDLDLKRSQLKTDELERSKLRRDLAGGGDEAPTVKSINGVDMQWNPSKGRWETIDTTGGAPDQMAVEKGADKVLQLDSLINNTSGINASAGLWRRTGLANLQNSKDWQADVKNVLSKLTVDELGRVKLDGVTFGALSDSERKAVGDAASALNAGMIMGDDGITPTGKFNISESKVKKELEIIKKYAEIDFQKRTGMNYSDYSAGKLISPEERAELEGYLGNTALVPGQFDPSSYYNQ